MCGDQGCGVGEFTGVAGEPQGTDLFAVFEFLSLPSKLVGFTSTLLRELASDPIGESMSTSSRGICKLGIFSLYTAALQASR